MLCILNRIALLRGFEWVSTSCKYNECPQQMLWRNVNYHQLPTLSDPLLLALGKHWSNKLQNFHAVLSFVSHRFDKWNWDTFARHFGSSYTWAATWQNQQNGKCTQRRLTLIRVFAVRMKKAWVLLATHWVHSDNSDQTMWMPRLIWVFAGHTLILLVLSWGGSYFAHCLTPDQSKKQQQSHQLVGLRGYNNYHQHPKNSDTPKNCYSYMTYGLFHPYQLDESISKFRSVWCIFLLWFYFW